MSIPRHTQETAIVRYADEREWTFDTSDFGMIQRLRNGGWDGEEAGDGYVRFRLPLKGVKIRSRRVVESFAQRPNIAPPRNQDAT